MITSLCIIRYPRFFIPFALLAMAVHRLPLALNRQCRFWKLMGCGRNGTFDLNPDWNQWALLTVWENEADWIAFEQESLISKWWRIFRVERWCILLNTLSAHGYWDEKQPFISKFDSSDHVGPVCVLTRATIRAGRLREFWEHVPMVSDIMRKAPGYVMSVGIGEAPFYRQATFSIWKSLEDVKNFAYRGEEHSAVVKQTRERNWYSEELFARFAIVSSSGTLNGVDPLKN